MMKERPAEVTRQTKATDDDACSCDESFRSFLVLSGMGDWLDCYCDGARKCNTDNCNDDDCNDDDDDDSVLSATTAARRVRNAKVGHLASILLFVVGSVLYVVLAAWDYQWARSVQGWPEEVLVNYNDDITYNNYRLKVLYYGSEAAVEEAEGGGRLRRILFGRRRGYYEYALPLVNFFRSEFPSEVRYWMPQRRKS
jgi:hypothetical protein